MNGRIYDPELGRMLSPDPYVQVPEYSQNFNRYSYVMNNPLNLTDPSGFNWWNPFSVHKKLHNWVKENWRTVVVIVVAIVAWYVAPYNIAGFYGAAGIVTTPAVFQGAAGAMAGAANAANSGGDMGDILRGALVGGIQGGISGGVLHQMQSGASTFADKAAHVAGHGILGGAANEAMGGKFQDGFLSAAAGAGAGWSGVYGAMQGTGVVGKTITAGIIGGTASALGGGKFANGAWTAAFQHLLNDELKSLIREKKAFLVGPDQTEDFVDPRHGTGKRSDLYETMLEAARNSGFEIYEDATYNTLKSVWESREYDTIVCYNNGKGHQIQYNYGKNYGFRPLSVVFSTKSGYPKNLVIICCHYNKVVTPNLFDYFKSNVNLMAVPAPQMRNGEVDRTVAQMSLKNFFGK